MWWWRGWKSSREQKIYVGVKPWIVHEWKKDEGRGGQRCEKGKIDSFLSSVHTHSLKSSTSFFPGGGGMMLPAWLQYLIIILPPLLICLLLQLDKPTTKQLYPPLHSRDLKIASSHNQMWERIITTSPPSCAQLAPETKEGCGERNSSVNEVWSQKTARRRGHLWIWGGEWRLSKELHPSPNISKKERETGLGEKIIAKGKLVDSPDNVFFLKSLGFIYASDYENGV